MLALAAIFFSSFVIALSGAMMPGPVLTATISESARRGAAAAPLLMAGHAILEMGLILALLMGLAPLIAGNDAVFACVSLGGALILAWMGAGILRSAPRAELVLAPAGRRSGRLVASGIALSLANPYWSVWWATIGLGYILQSQKFGVRGVAVFFAGHILADLAWYSAVGMAVAKGRRFLTVRAYRLVLSGCGGLLLVFSAWFAWSGAARAVSLARGF